VWDTVSSVGWVWDPTSFPYTKTNPSVRKVRHAVSIDERRCFFRQNLFTKADGQDLVEMWFPGVHSDLGGGYPEADGGLWRVCFEWLLGEGQEAGLLIDAARRTKVETRSPMPAEPWAEPKHESLTPAWWLAEFFPKLPKGSDFRWPTLGLGRHRRIHDGAWLSKAALLRIRRRDLDYAPSNVPEAVLGQIRELETVPDWWPLAAQSASSE
jgi:hypothetical protein